MSFSPFEQPKTYAVTSTVVVEPIYHLLTAMSLLTALNVDTDNNVDTNNEEWLSNTAAKLTPEQRHTNRIIFDWFGSALLPAANYTTFTSFLTALDNILPTELVDRAVRAWIDSADPQDESSVDLLKEQAHFAKFATATTPDLVDESELLAEVHQLISEPAELHALITGHLRMLWETYFASEWKKKRAAMIYCAEELNAREWPTESPRTLLQSFIRSSIPDSILTQFAGVRQIKIVPSPYIGLHAARFEEPDILWVFMLADFWRLPMRTEPIQRGEIMGPASALADDTRLQILELLAAHDELRAQEIIAQMDTSQSTISRHLKQLTNANFLTEKRAGGANKIYQLNRSRVSEFAHTLAALLSAENARMVLNDARLDQPTALQPYLDRNGLVTTWPAKQKGQLAVLDYLGDKFVEGEKYTEKQVNNLLTKWHTYGNPAYLRRSLIDVGLLQRTPNGSEYWRAEL